ncbi:hypothetical protein YW7DRAFT_03214 [Streptomyces sp. AmelKG-E11A]|nr:hypothetical protein YW7DRAFT_03214 [Streptomyces sp. AmelKG-E11A]
MRQQELADALNKRIESFTGRYGTLLDRHIRNWLTGKTRWPQARQRRALEEEFGCDLAELGFQKPPPRSAVLIRQASVEESVKRRRFTTSAAAITATAALPDTASASTPRIGMADVDRLQTAFTQVLAANNVHGGNSRLEERALTFAQHVTELQTTAVASQRVRQELYYLAAAFTGSAFWAASEAQAPERAQQYLDRAFRLAGLSGKPDIQFLLYGHAAFLSSDLGHVHDALAAKQAAKASPLCRRDSLYRSLAAARIACSQAQLGEHTQARRSLEVAARAFDQADPAEPRAAWIGFYDRSELEGLSGLAMAHLGMHDQAEAHFHRTLAHLRPEYQRNKKYYSSHLAMAQLRQGDVDQAYATASSALPDDGGPLPTGRQRKLLTKFHRELALTDTRAATSWADRYPTKGNHR